MVCLLHLCTRTTCRCKRLSRHVTKYFLKIMIQQTLNTRNIENNSTLSFSDKQEKILNEYFLVVEFKIRTNSYLVLFLQSFQLIKINSERFFFSQLLIQFTKTTTEICYGFLELLTLQQSFL